MAPYAVNNGEAINIPMPMYNSIPYTPDSESPCYSFYPIMRVTTPEKEINKHIFSVLVKVSPKIKYPKIAVKSGVVLSTRATTTNGKILMAWMAKYKVHMTYAALNRTCRYWSFGIESQTTYLISHFRMRTTVRKWMIHLTESIWYSFISGLWVNSNFANSWMVENIITKVICINAAFILSLCC